MAPRTFQLLVRDARRMDLNAGRILISNAYVPESMSLFNLNHTVFFQYSLISCSRLNEVASQLSAIQQSLGIVHSATGLQPAQMTCLPSAPFKDIPPTMKQSSSNAIENFSKNPEDVFCLKNDVGNSSAAPLLLGNILVERSDAEGLFAQYVLVLAIYYEK